MRVVDPSGRAWTVRRHWARDLAREAGSASMDALLLGRSNAVMWAMLAILALMVGAAALGWFGAAVTLLSFLCVPVLALGVLAWRLPGRAWTVTAKPDGVAHPRVTRKVHGWRDSTRFVHSLGIEIRAGRVPVGPRT